MLGFILLALLRARVSVRTSQGRKALAPALRSAVRRRREERPVKGTNYRHCITRKLPCPRILEVWGFGGCGERHRWSWVAEGGEGNFRTGPRSPVPLAPKGSSEGDHRLPEVFRHGGIQPWPCEGPLQRLGRAGCVRPVTGRGCRRSSWTGG